MKKQSEQLRNAIFLITQEKNCPIYNVGEEIKVANNGLTISLFKPVCLFLAHEVKGIVAAQNSFGGFSKMSTKKTRFDCGGCEGIIHFEYKKDKDYATVQMKLLNEAEEKRKRQHLDKFFGVLRRLAIFESLEDDALTDLTLLLDLKSIPLDKVVAKKGEAGSNLYIVLKGTAAVIGDDGSTIAELKAGEIFGEMSLLSGEPVTNSVHTVTPIELAVLSVKNFRNVIVKYPVLQMFLFKMLVDRAQTMALRSGNITSGMTGELAEISSVDLFQLINSSQKTGSIELILHDGKALVLFKEGQVVHARYLKLRNQEAVFALLSVTRGSFSYSKGLPGDLDKLPPIGDFMGLLMEGLQRIDENTDGK